MRKLLLSVIVAFISIIHANGATQTLTINTSELGLANAEVVSSVETGTSAVSIELAKGSASSDPAYYNTGNGIRVYKNGTMTFTAAENYKITEITLTGSTTSYMFKGSCNNGTLSYSSTNTKWAGESDKIILTMDASDAPKYCRLTHISVTYDYVAVASVEPVEISCEIVGAEGIVTLACPTEDAEIYYGFSEDSMDKKYTAPFTVNENCTVYAYAVKGEDKSIPQNYYIDLPYTSFKKVIESSQATDYVTAVGNFQVIYQNSDKGRLLLTDGTSNLLIYKSGNNYSIDYPVGTKISKIEGSVATYNKCFRLIDAELIEGGEGASIVALELSSFEGITYEDNIFDEVSIKNCNISGKDLGQPVIELGEESIGLYDLFELGYENVVGCDITGFVWKYKDDMVIVPIVIEGGEVTATVESPVITPNKLELQLNELVTITCATEGAVIYYTLDESEPTQESEKYEEPIPFTESCTIKARAYYEGEDKVMFPSAVVEKTYQVFDPTCNVISEGNHDVDDKNSLNTYKKHTCTVDGVEYHMNAAHLGEGGNGNAGSNYSIMMNNKKYFCYLIQVGENEGYVVDKIELAYNNEAKTEFAVRGANTPFDDSADEQDVYKAAITGHGNLIGGMSKDNQSIEFKKNYKYFAIYPTNEGAVYLDHITIRYREAAIAPAPELADELGDDFESDEEVLLIPQLPSHEDWTAMYQVNDGDAFEAEVDDITYHEEALDAATLHSIKIWYEHYNGVDKTEPKTYYHLTAPQVTIENANQEDENPVTTINFGTIGEGVVVYFTLNGTAPNISEAALRARAKAAAADGEYNIESLADIDAVHAVTADTKVVKIHAMEGETLPEISLVTKAVHPEMGISSSIKYHDDTIDLPTGIEDINAADASEAVYFNLQGVRVENPENGTFIRVLKGKAEKMMK